MLVILIVVAVGMVVDGIDDAPPLDGPGDGMAALSLPMGLIMV
jgi:hypothetical protein